MTIAVFKTFHEKHLQFSKNDLMKGTVSSLNFSMSRKGRDKVKHQAKWSISYNLPRLILLLSRKSLHNILSE